ncbi:Two-component response regulator ORR24 [Dichanthelium oligosanthes]|uniref:Two-component response regulator ORR24 n=1 Tax=Dichanthelium oligosanthes TaxID=888268 RepID=A0A1E5VBT7_9POAL|nr:Two-component response regulator ORR24 [Dichanthelium oligosanthes]
MGTKARSGWRAGSGALKPVWRTVTARPRAWRIAPGWSMGLMWPWNGNGKSTTPWRRGLSCAAIGSERQCGCCNARSADSDAELAGTGSMNLGARGVLGFLAGLLALSAVAFLLLIVFVLMGEGMDVNMFPAGLRVLAVDDNCTTRFVLKRQLQHCNYNVTTVTEAETALHMLRETKDRDDQFHLVISDVVMPGIDGFKLLEVISLEMDIPVIMLSANEEMETMMKGIKHGACDYLVKPARMEQIRNIWTHVVRKSSISDKKKGANHTKKLTKNKKDGDCAEEDNAGTSTQKRQRISWSRELHRKFVEAINKIGLDRAVPKNILQVMNVDGLNRGNVASHLQKYRLYLKKMNEGTLRHSNPFVDELQAWQSAHTPADKNAPASSQDHLELVHPAPSSIGASSSSNAFSMMSCPSPFGMNNLQQDMELVGNGVNLPEDVPVPVQDVSRFISSGSSSANMSNGVVFNISIPFSSGTSGSSSAKISNDCSPLATSMHFPSSRSCSNYASILRAKMLEANRGIPFDADSFIEEIAAGEMPDPSSQLQLQSPELANQHSVQIQSSSAGLFNQVAPSGHLPLQSPELVNQPLTQIQSSSAGLFNQVSRESHQFAGPSNPSNSWKIGVTSRFPDISHSAGMSIGSSQGNSVKINQLTRFVASTGLVPTLENGYQNQMSGLMGRPTLMVGFSEEAVAPFNFGSSAMPIGSSAPGTSSSVRPALANLQIGNSVMLTQMPNGGDATGNSNALGSSSSVRPALANLQIANSVMLTQVPNGGGETGNLPGGGTADQQAVGDQVNNRNGLPAGTKAQNGAINDMDDLFAGWVNHVRSFLILFLSAY